MGKLLQNASKGFSLSGKMKWWATMSHTKRTCCMMRSYWTSSKSVNRLDKQIRLSFCSALISAHVLWYVTSEWFKSAFNAVVLRGRGLSAPNVLTLMCSSIYYWNKRTWVEQILMICYFYCWVLFHLHLSVVLRNIVLRTTSTICLVFVLCQGLRGVSFDFRVLICPWWGQNDRSGMNICDFFFLIPGPRIKQCFSKWAACVANIKTE